MTTSMTMMLVAALGTGAPTPSAPPTPCGDHPLGAALDFWLGDWSVRIGGQEVGTNHIEKVLEGCAVTESWTDARGGEGRSLFYLVPAVGEWRQVWVTEDATQPGGVKEKRTVAGAPEGSVRFQGEIRLVDGRSYLDRTTLTPLEGDRVRQLIEISTDGGESWRATFDAVYVRPG